MQHVTGQSLQLSISSQETIPHPLLYIHYRKERLAQSLLYHKFCVEVDEEEAWLNEKMAFVSSEEAGDTLAAVQELMKKHEAFETDLGTHCERVHKIEREGGHLVEQVCSCNVGTKTNVRENSFGMLLYTGQLLV